MATPLFLDVDQFEESQYIDRMAKSECVELPLEHARSVLLIINFYLSGICIVRYVDQGLINR